MALQGHRPSANLKEKGKNIFSPSTLMSAVRWGKLRIYTIYNPPEVIFKLVTCDY